MRRADAPQLIADFATPRLRVAHWAASLAVPVPRAAMLKALPTLLTPQVMRDLPPSMALTGTPEAWVAARAGESDVYLVTHDDALIGLLILFADAQNAVLHLGYVFAPAHWGQGYATELLQGLIAAVHPPLTLLAGVTTTNPASAQVLRKVGFTMESAQQQEGMLWFSRRLKP